MRAFLIAVVLFFGILFIFARASEIETIASTLQQGDWRFFFLALTIQVLWIVNNAGSYYTAFQVIGVKEDFKHILLLSSAVYFANIVTPVGGVTGLAIFMERARRKGYSTARSAVASTIFFAFEYLGFLLILFAGVTVLIRRNNFQPTDFLAALAMVALALAFTSVIILGTHAEQTLESVLTRLAQGINRLASPLLHRPLICVERARNFSREASAGLKELRLNPQKALAPLGLGLSSKLLMMTNFALMFLAFKIPISIGTIVAGYMIAYLFQIISPTPSGLGIVEAALPLALQSMYIPLGVGVVLTIAYRAFTFWMPLLCGMAAFRWLHRVT